jgi:hypothetical protein
MELMKGYLRRELFNKPADGNGQDNMVSRRKAVVRGFQKMEVQIPNVPLQENPFDCGIFVLEYLVYLLRCPAAFATLGLESHDEWFDQAVVTHRRQRMRDIVDILQREGQRLGDGDVLALLQNGDIRSAIKEALSDEPDKQTESSVPSQLSVSSTLPALPKAAQAQPKTMFHGMRAAEEQAGDGVASAIGRKRAQEQGEQLGSPQKRSATSFW